MTTTTPTHLDLLAATCKDDGNRLEKVIQALENAVDELGAEGSSVRTEVLDSLMDGAMEVYQCRAMLYLMAEELSRH